jgi:C4-dicarboxylate-specific signal transduction histidine kinase
MHVLPLARQARVLVVDDDPVNRVVLEALLVEAQYTVFQAEDGPQALAEIDRLDPDVVLLDLTMPGMSGVEVCRRLRENGSQIPVVFVTGRVDREARILCKAAGGDEVLTKPVDELELLARMKNLVLVREGQRLREQHRQRVEAELERAREELVRVDRMATLGKLAAGVGHELNNVAAVYLSLLTAVKECHRTGERLREDDLQALDWVGAHLTCHARQLLSAGRPAGTEKAVVDLRETTQAMLALLNTVGKTRRVEVHTSFPEVPVRVAVNRMRLEQILVNLVGNAVDAVEDGGRGSGQITVRVGGDPAAGTASCCVEDNGCGIPTSALQAVLEPFYTTKPAGRGTGLGLTVVRQLLQEAGGRLDIQSVHGEGSSFTFTLPLSS